MFLLRLLLRRLALKLPTALQIGPNDVVFFHGRGVEEFVRLDKAALYRPLLSSPPDRIWALVDSNRQLEMPSPVFVDGPFFVVEVAYPRPSRQEWARSIRHKRFFMRPWSFSEVLQA